MVTSVCFAFRVATVDRVTDGITANAGASNSVAPIVLGAVRRNR